MKVVVNDLTKNGPGASVPLSGESVRLVYVIGKLMLLVKYKPIDPHQLCACKRHDLFLVWFLLIH